MPIMILRREMAVSEVIVERIEEEILEFASAAGMTSLDAVNTSTVF